MCQIFLGKWKICTTQIIYVFYYITYMYICMSIYYTLLLSYIKDHITNLWEASREKSRWTFWCFFFFAKYSSYIQYYDEKYKDLNVQEYCVPPPPSSKSSWVQNVDIGRQQRKKKIMKHGGKIFFDIITWILFFLFCSVGLEYTKISNMDIVSQ